MQFKTVPVADLIVDKRYQRELDKRRVEKIVKEFDPRLLGTLEVSVRNGKSAVFDGQHRLAALKKLKIDAAPVLSHTDLSPEHEAKLFEALQRGRRSLTPVDRYRARLFAKDSAILEIDGIVQDTGWKVAEHNGAWDKGTEIRAVATLERIHKRGGPGDLAGTLELLTIWRGDPRATDSHLMGGAYLLLRDYGLRVGEDARARLAEVSPVVILRRAHGNQMVGGGIAAAVPVAAELRKIAGVRGRPEARKKPA